MPRNDEDSLFWRIERACAALQYEVAASHARKGGSVVILTNRKLRGAPGPGVTEISTKGEGRLAFHGVKVVSTRGERP